MTLIYLLDEIVGPLRIIIRNILNRLEVGLYNSYLIISKCRRNLQTTISLVGICPLVSVSILSTSKRTGSISSETPGMAGIRLTKLTDKLSIVICLYNLFRGVSLDIM